MRIFGTIFAGTVLLLVLGCSPRQPRRAADSPPELGIADWVGTYTYDNPGGEEGKWLLGNEYELEIREAGASQLAIFAKSMGSDHGKFGVQPALESNRCHILFRESLKKTRLPSPSLGDTLFTLVQEAEGLRTEWGTWRPLYGEFVPKGMAFIKQ